MDSFNAAVHNSKALSNVEKFNYLRTFLEGEAQYTISGLSLTNDNYSEALNLLKNRFGNNLVIISAHMNTLVKLPSVNNEDVKALRNQEFCLFLKIPSLNVHQILTCSQV